MPEMYRKRLVPQECIHLKDDQIIAMTEEFVVTKWETLRPKAEFSHGISYYDIPNGYKVSKFYRADHTLAYIYCDIISTEYQKETDTYVFTDLLADVIIENDKTVRVVDLEELGDALTDGIISSELLSEALHKLNNLLACIYDGSFDHYLEALQQYE